MAEDRTHVYEGEPDARQTASTESTGLFRLRYRALKPEEVALHDAIKDKASELAVLIGKLNPDVAKRMGVAITIAAIEAEPFIHEVRDPANVTLAIRHLEDAVYRAVKALTA